MKIIPSKFHGMLDYVVAVTLIVGPLVLQFDDIAKNLAMAGGIGLLIYSLITDYSLSARKLLPFKTHLVFDFLAALVLIAAPFVFGFTGLTNLFYLVIGIAVIAVVLITNPVTEAA